MLVYEALLWRTASDEATSPPDAARLASRTAAGAATPSATSASMSASCVQHAQDA